MNPLDGLIAGYNCDGDTVDFTGITGDATATGSTFTTPPVIDIFDEAALHDGFDDYWSLPSTGIVNLDQAFSFGGWNNFSNAIGNFEIIMGNGSPISGTNNFKTFLRRESSGKLMFQIGKTGVWQTYWTSDNAILANAGEAFHIFATYDGSQTSAGMKFYLNGSEITARTLTGSFSSAPTDTDSWLLGNETSLTFDMAGKQNQMLLYDKEVSADLISYLYNGGAGRALGGITYPSIIVPVPGITPLSVPTTIPGGSENNTWITN